MENTTEEFGDYRYILDDLSHIAVGARYCYQELADNMDVSYKFRCIIKRVLEREAGPQMTIESHLYGMTTDSESYQVYHHLRTKVRCYRRSRKRRLFGSARYEETLMPIEELAAMTIEEKTTARLLITEIQIPKMRLANYAI